MNGFEQCLSIEQKHRIVSTSLVEKEKFDRTKETGGKERREGGVTNRITNTVKKIEEHLDRAKEVMIIARGQVEKVYNEKWVEAEEFVIIIN